jgi:hypothetical protein
MVGFGRRFLCLGFDLQNGTGALLSEDPARSENQSTFMMAIGGFQMLMGK